MIEYVSENLWLFWTIITFVCLILELSSGDFFVISFAIGGVFGVISALVGLPFWGQVIVWALFSVLSLWLVRPRLLKILHKNGEDRTSNADALIGRIGTVIEPIEPNGYGYVKVDGDNWRAETDEPETIKKGEKVRILSRNSIIVKVARA